MVDSEKYLQLMMLEHWRHFLFIMLGRGVAQKEGGGEAFCSYIYLLQVLEIRREM